MPIISSVTSPSGSQSVPQKADLKPIGICLPTNSSIDMSNSGTTLATNRVTTTSSTANYFNSTSAQSSAPSGAIPVGALSVMVARFAGDNSRPQTVILHQRPVGSNNRAGLQMSGLRASTVISGQTISTTGSTPSLTSSSASISVRTTQLIGGQQHPTNTLPVLNLSTVTNANTSGVSSHSSTAIKQICSQNRPFISTSTGLPIESVSLVMANPNEPNVVNTRPIRLHQSSDMKPNTIHTINKLSGQRTTLVTGSPLMANQSTKMAIIGTGPPTATSIGQVARVGIIGQLGTGQTTSANKNIINLPKGHLFFNSTTTSNSTLHNMVNVSHSVGNSVTSFTTSAQSLPQTAKLSLNSNANNLITTRHSVVSNTAPFITHNVTNSSQHIHTTHRPIGHQNANTNLLHTSSQPQQQLLQTPMTTGSTTSPIRPTILSSPAGSPIKQTQLQVSTPSSPRPSILIRKRPNDSHTGLTPTALFKTSAPNSAISGQTIPLRLAHFGIKSNDSLTVIDTRVSDGTAINDLTLAANCTPTVPTTPNSDGSQTPRKKPRKQLLEPSSLKTSQNMRLLNSTTLDAKDICNDKDSVVHVNRKPRVSLLSSYNMGWKSLQYHFMKYSDVRPKPEKKLTLSELSNEGLQRKNGWKIHHLATQMEVMTDNEHNVYQRLHHFLDTFERDVSLNNNSNHQTSCQSQSSIATTSSSTKPTNSSTNSVCDSNSSSSNRTIGASDCSVDTISVKLNDLIRGNLQRSNLFSDQITEAKQLIVKLTTDHKERVGKITKKCANKRTYITK